ncbi:FAT domain-containing protein [Suillus variegatus]|nr:FAT domain-containing protein [Suillus variegatus]
MMHFFATPPRSAWTIVDIPVLRLLDIAIHHYLPVLEYGVSKHEEWYERLGRWQEALNTYEKKAQEDPDLLEPELTSFVGEGYGQSHNTLVRAQVLSELEEIIVYKQYADQTDHQAAMQKTWMKRALVLNPEDDPVMWIKFANLCCKSDRMVLTEKTINSLLSPERHLRDNQHLKAPLNIHNSNVETKDHSQRSGVGKAKLEELSRLLARCYFKQGQWQVELKEDRGPVPGQRNVKDILHSYLLATHYDPNWYKAWRTWALANFEVIGHLESQKESMAANIPGSGLAAHTVPAHSEIGFFRSIGLQNENTLQDTLRLLTLWFKFGTHDYVSQAMANGFSMVEVDMWLEVIPQIIARIQTPSINVRRNINNLLTEVGKLSLITSGSSIVDRPSYSQIQIAIHLQLRLKPAMYRPQTGRSDSFAVFTPDGIKPIGTNPNNPGILDVIPLIYVVLNLPGRQTVSSRQTLALRANYSAAAGLSKESIQTRILDVLKGFEKVDIVKTQLRWFDSRGGQNTKHLSLKKHVLVDIVGITRFDGRTCISVVRGSSRGPVQ